MIVTWTAHKIKTKNILKSSDMVIEGSGVVPPGDIGGCMEKKLLIRNAHFESWSRLGHFIIRSISLEEHVFCDGLCQHRDNFLNGLRTCAEEVDGSSFYINGAETGFLWQLHRRGYSEDMLHMEWKFSANIHRNHNITPNHKSVAAE